MAMIKIGGTQLPNPTAYAVTRRDGDSENTNRDEQWVLHRERIREGMYQIEITWQAKKPQISDIAAALSPDSINVLFFDPTTGGNASATMYAGDRKGSLLAYPDEDKPDDSLWELSVSLIEY